MAVPSPESGLWYGRLRPWVERHARMLALCLVTIGVIRIVAVYPENGITFDEPGHMACGLQFLGQHVYRYESQHPPLARVMAALGPYLDGARPLGGPQQDQEGVAVLYRDPRHVLRTVVLMRLGILPFFILACAVVYLWTDHSFGRRTAVAATALFTLLPPVLAHSALGTTDMPVAALFGAAFFSSLLWAERPSLVRSVWLGFWTGLMVLAKFTALAYFPCAVGLALVGWLLIAKLAAGRLSELATKRVGPFAAAVAVGALVIWAGYLFSFGKPPGWNLSVPAPELFDGIRSALGHNQIGHVAYLFGEISQTGWWYYFPVVLGVKTPLAFLVLAVLGSAVWWSNRRQLSLWMPIALALGVLLPAMVGRVNIGVRHVLPIYIGLSILAGVALVRLLEWIPRSPWLGYLAAALFLWTFVSGLIAHPDYLAYFNEFAGARPENVLVDSDLDWGQDTVRLARRLDEMGVGGVSFMTMNLSGEKLRSWPGVPAVGPVDPLRPVGGWSAISPTFWKLNQYGLNFQSPTLEPWWEHLRPAGRVGSTLLYYIPPQ